MTESDPRWRFFIDRGGTFTDLVARGPDGRLFVEKLLSKSPEQYEDAALAGIRRVLGRHAGLPPDAPLSGELIESVKMGTTVATNALLERKGEPVALAITRGFRDALGIAYQNRPRLFARRILLPEPLHTATIEIDERVGSDGNVLRPLDESAARRELAGLRRAGFRALAIVLLHAYRFPDNEARLVAIAHELGFSEVSASHQVSPLIKLVARGDTTVVDAYLSPVLHRYVRRMSAALPGVRFELMQSSGGLVEAGRVRGKDALLSGPAGGVVGMVKTGLEAGFTRLIGFDMGGTSTDVTHFAGRRTSDAPRVFDSEVGGVRVRAPMLSIRTVAAGGGSLLHFDGSRYRVGPDSAGADPGPACYRRGGPLTVTDCNVMLGKLVPDHFPHVFGPDADQPLDAGAVRREFEAMARRIGEATGTDPTPESVAEGFIAVAVDNMANAIKQVSLARGHDPNDHTLFVFGGAGGQHACLVADSLGMTEIVSHPLAGVLSAYGMGLAERAALREHSLEIPLVPEAMSELHSRIETLAESARAELLAQGERGPIEVIRSVHLRYAGSDGSLAVPLASPSAMRADFEALHRERFQFIAPGKPLVVATVSVEAVAAAEALAGAPEVPTPPPRSGRLEPRATTRLFAGGSFHDAPLFERAALLPGDVIPGPAVVLEAAQTIVIEAGWQATPEPGGHLLLTRHAPLRSRPTDGGTVDPVLLELFNNRFMSIAEEMGLMLQKTAHSVNIKERLDFSCALFDAGGELVANAPHVPVHLGSMSESVASVLRDHGASLSPGDVFVLNDPYNGGTHLPDITVITPVFAHPAGVSSMDAASRPLFFVGSRGHHADVGGKSPGSMPADSSHIDEEGILLDGVKLLDRGRFDEARVRALFLEGPWPARNVDQNLSDLLAQVAANAKGAAELLKLVAERGLSTVSNYMRHVQDNAEEAVRRVIGALDDGSYEYRLDPIRGGPLDGRSPVVRVAIRVDRACRGATIDFTGSSPELPNNFNAPRAIAIAAVLYVFRTLVEDEIPLNAGCLKPLGIVVPEGSFLNPRHPAAVAAGNVETSQAIVQALYGALGAMSESAGTMNNLSFGDDRHQYYETLANGSAAGVERDPTGRVIGGFTGTDAVQTHMTNSRLTDPEVLEQRFPVLVESFAVRRGSGGRGRYPGGNGVVRKLRFLAPMTVSLLSGNRVHPPRGAFGGQDGQAGENRIERSDGRIEELSGCAIVDVFPGDLLVVETPGAGGFGA